MKKISTLILALFISGWAMAQNTDKCRQSLGFFISPGFGETFYKESSLTFSPRFTGSIGYRFANRLKGGFYIESGFYSGIYQVKSTPFNDSWIEHHATDHIIHDYTYLFRTTEHYLNLPFYVGYRGTQGKVRFNGAFGFSLNMKVLQHKLQEYTGGERPSINAHPIDVTELKFGMSFSGIVRAGISIPIKDWICLDILPSFCYRAFYFTANEYDLTQSIKSEIKPWSAGLDISLMIALKDRDSKNSTRIQDAQSTVNDINTLPTDSNSSPSEKGAAKYKEPCNMVYFEIAGNGMNSSFNYERTLYSKGSFHLNIRGGFGFTPEKYAFPVGFNIALGKTSKKFETGVTFTTHNFNRLKSGKIDPKDKNYNDPNFAIDPGLAFRIESRSHLFFRMSILCHYFPITGGVMPGAGISMGGCF